MKKFMLFFMTALLVYTPAILTAQEQSGISLSRELTLQISSLPEAKFGFTQKFIFPVFQGDSPLTSGNNLALDLTAEISPVSLNGIARVVLTPVAFLQFTAGVRLGTGWNINLFGSDIFGNGLNLKGSPNTADGKPFDALLWKAFIGGTFQFDLAAIFPGDWNHVVMQTYHEINYSGNTRAAANQPWFFESDSGENRNGFNYYGNFLLGYQMPIFLNTVAFLAEMDLYLYDTPGRTAWGDDLIRWKFAPVFQFTVTEQFGIALITQFRTVRNYNESNWKGMHFTDRTINNSKPLSVEFYRVAVILALKL